MEGPISGPHHMGLEETGPLEDSKKTELSPILGGLGTLGICALGPPTLEE